ncbi:MAG: hypothetical protein MPJ78_12730 [Hyphomicrobiaceae bacterium]|nr:hypothetical protein [Hyphomicrobiaceae bacterium]
MIALTLAAMLGGCAVESYPGLSTSNDLEAPVLSSDQQKEVIRDLTAAQEKHRSEDGTDEQKVQ